MVCADVTSGKLRLWALIAHHQASLLVQLSAAAGNNVGVTPVMSFWRSPSVTAAPVVTASATTASASAGPSLSDQGHLRGGTDGAGRWSRLQACYLLACCQCRLHTLRAQSNWWSALQIPRSGECVTTCCRLGPQRPRAPLGSCWILFCPQSSAHRDSYTPVSSQDPTSCSPWNFGNKRAVAPPRHSLSCLVRHLLPTASKWRSSSCVEQPGQCQSLPAR